MKKFCLTVVICLLIAGITVGILVRPQETSALAEPDYPQTAANPFTAASDAEWDNTAYDAWRADQQARRTAMETYRAEDLENYLIRTTREFLNTPGENRIYSPLNVYMALAMLAEVTDGTSRAQVLQLLEVDTLSELRTRVNAIWRAYYTNDGVTKCLLANSLWLNDSLNFHTDTVQTLSDHYYAAVYRGTMGSSELDAMFQTWLNENTGNLLSDQIKELTLSPETVLALASTVDFAAAWDEDFLVVDPQPFHGTSGDTEITYLNCSESLRYYAGERFTAVCRPFKDCDESMWFILPAEGITPEELTCDAELMKFLLNPDAQHQIVNLTVPKFDVSSQTDLSGILQTLGVTDVLDPFRADFSAITDTPQTYLSTALHGARVSIDEKGCVAAAYTVMIAEAAGIIIEEPLEFFVDRPFIFAITGADNLPLFMGTVNNL